MSEVTQILAAIEAGDPLAAEQLLPLVYDELRKLAAQKIAQEKPGQTLQATALVHEAYLRLVGNQNFANRRHFFAAAAQAMRRILIDSARRKQLAPRVDIDGLQLTAQVNDERLLDLHDALERLAIEEPMPHEWSRRAFSPVFRWTRQRRRWGCRGPPPIANGHSPAPGWQQR